jgi:hypothetical protein
MSEFLSFLRLNNIPLYGCTIFCLPIHLFDRYFGLLPPEAIANDAAMNMDVQIVLQVLALNSLGIYTEVELLDHMVVFNFKNKLLLGAGGS